MSVAKGRKKHLLPAGLLAVLMLSILSLEITFVSSRFLGAREESVADTFMRWKQILSYGKSGINTKNIILLAIDTKTESMLGRFGAGMWLSRKPFIDNIIFFKNYFKPAEIAYDILFIESLAVNSADKLSVRVSENKEKREEIAQDLMTSLSGTSDMLQLSTLENMNRLVCEQGNKTYANELAELLENGVFDCVMAMHMRGGEVDKQPIQIEGWTDKDVFGDSPDGNEDRGDKIPYLKDMAIPDEDVHFASEKQRSNYIFSPNGSLPTRDFLDYVYMAPINVPREVDGVVRRVPLVIGTEYYNTKKREVKHFFMPSFSLVTTMLHLGFDFPLQPHDVEVFWGRHIQLNSPVKGKICIPIDDIGRMYLNYDNSFNDFDAISFADVALPINNVTKTKMQSALRWKKNIDGRIAIVGATATGIDVGSTPLYSNIPLVFVQMTAINNILNGTFLAPLKGWPNVVLWLILFATLTTLSHFEKTVRLVPAGILLGVLYIVSAYSCIHNNITILPVIRPLLYMVLCLFSVLSYRFFTEEKAKRQIRGMFSTMVSGKVLSYLEENPQSFSLRGQNIEASVFFSDVASFTSISEFMRPEKLTAFLNSYLTPVTNCIMEWDGFVDKYVGDGIMAVWGAPNPDPEHSRKACFSALEQQEIIDNMNQQMLADYGSEISVRMSINSGMVTAGNMGSEKKFQYTVMGDVVNLASRLEPVNKDYSTKIVIGPRTYELAKDHIEARMLDKIIVVGKKEIVPIYELLGKKGQVSDETLEVSGMYSTALQTFFLCDWAMCIEIANKILALRADEPTVNLRKRALEYQKNPPPEGWMGEYVRKSKE